MSRPTVEDRLRWTLQEVANRVADDVADDQLPPLAFASHSRPTRMHRLVVAGVAALLLAVVGLGVAELSRTNENEHLATEGGPATLLVVEPREGVGVELRLVRRHGSPCLALVDNAGLEPPAPPACLSDGSFPLQATMVGATTAVYGLHRSAADFSWVSDEGSTGDFRQAAFEGGRAFLLLVDHRRPAGAISALDAESRILAVARFDGSGPERPPTGALGDVSLDYAYTSQGAIWAVGTDGRVVRLTDGTPRDANGWPSASPAGDLVFFTENDWEGVFWRPMAVAVGDGSISERRQFASTLSPDASLAAGMIPLDDTGAPTEIAIVDVENDAELFRIALGLNYEIGDVQTLAWDGNQRLLALTRPTNDVEVRKELWSVDLATRTASALTPDGGIVGRALLVAEQTRSPGRYPVVRVLAGRAEWGDLVLGEGTAAFERRAALPAGADGHSIDLGGRLYLDSRGGVDGNYLLGDGRSLFELTPEGKLRFLRGDVERASAP